MPKILSCIHSSVQRNNYTAKNSYRKVSQNIGTTVSSLARIPLDALCRETGSHSDCCTKMDKWLKRVNPRSRETPTATSRRPKIEGAPVGDSNSGCSSKSTSDQDVSSSTVVASQATSFFVSKSTRCDGRRQTLPNAT